MKKVLNCLLVDDEPLAQELIEKYINRVPYLRLTGKYSNAIEALDGVAQLKPDIVFLDINMPEMNGIEFLQSSAHGQASVILTTAYGEYALDGFEHGATDYLLKPVAFNRFMKAIQKVLDKLPAGVVNPAQEPEPQLPEKKTAVEDQFFLVKEDKKYVKVNTRDIVYVEGMKDYVKIHLQDRFIVTYITMTKLSELLPPPRFLRINRSFIVQFAYIKLFEGNQIETVSGKKLPIGINYRDAIKESMQHWLINC